MKRRKFIQATLVGAAATASTGLAKEGGRLYGTPGSVTPDGSVHIGEKFMLPLSRAGVPVEGWSKLGAATQLLEDVLASSESSAAFSPTLRWSCCGTVWTRRTGRWQMRP